MANFIISELAKKDITDIWNSKVARRPQYRRTLERVAENQKQDAKAYVSGSSVWTDEQNQKDLFGW